MAIYQNSEQVERDLDNFRKSQDGNGELVDWFCGYDTAVDIATCVNAQTVWHKDELPADNEDVLCLCEEDGIRFMMVGQHDTTMGWISSDDNLNGMVRIIAWMELPDIPDFD